MVESKVLAAVQRYLAALPSVGIHASRAVLFGSFATGEARDESDIDVIIIAPELDSVRDLSVIERLWKATAAADDRIEPIPCGEREWETDGARPILEIARREGIVIAA